MSRDNPQTEIVPFVTLAFITLALNYGVRSTFGLFVKPLSHDFGASRGAISSILSFTMVTYGGTAFLTGYMNDRFGPKAVLVLGSLLAGLSFFISSYSTSPVHLMLTFGIMFGVATCYLSQITALSLLVKLPSDITSLALGLVGSGPAIGGILLTLSVAKIIDMAGWRLAMEVISLLFLSYLLLPLFLLRKRASVTGLSASPERARFSDILPELRNVGFLFFSFFLMCIGIYGVLSQEAAYATDKGISVGKAALALGMISGIGIIASPVIGWLSDRSRDRKRLAVYILWLSIGGVFLIYASNHWLMLVLGSIVIGTVYASYIPILPAIIRHLVGPGLFGRTWGLISMGGSLGAALGSWSGGFIYDLRNSYDLLWLILGVCFLASSLLLLMVNTDGQKQAPS